jgi:hypothetical protein
MSSKIPEHKPEKVRLDLRSTLGSVLDWIEGRGLFILRAHSPYDVLTLILSIMLMLSAYWLWNLRKSGGTLAIVSLIVDMLMGLIGLAILGLAYAPMAVIGFIINITILLLIALSWSSLT